MVRRCATPAKAAELVIGKAVKARGLRDDTTAVVAWLGAPAWVAAVQEKQGSPTLRRLRIGRRSGDGASSVSSSASSSPIGSPTQGRSPDNSNDGSTKWFGTEEWEQAGNFHRKSTTKIALGEGQEEELEQSSAANFQRLTVSAVPPSPSESSSVESLSTASSPSSKGPSPLGSRSTRS